MTVTLLLVSGQRRNVKGDEHVTAFPMTFTFPDGQTVNRIGFGAMRLTGQPGNFGPYEDWERGKAVLREAVSLGVQLFDTARAYGPHHSERLIADALKPYGAKVFIASKGGIEKDGPSAEFIKRDGRPETLRRHIEERDYPLDAGTTMMHYAVIDGDDRWPQTTSSQFEISLSAFRTTTRA